MDVRGVVHASADAVLEARQLRNPRRQRVDRRRVVQQRVRRLRGGKRGPDILLFLILAAGIYFFLFLCNNITWSAGWI